MNETLTMDESIAPPHWNPALRLELLPQRNAELAQELQAWRVGATLAPPLHRIAAPGRQARESRGKQTEQQQH